MKNNSSSIKAGAVISYFSVFLNIAITFFYTPWMIRQIGVSDYGLYSLVITFLSYFVMDFGLSGTVTRFIAKYRAEGDELKVSNMIGLITKCYLVIDALIFLVLLIVFFFISNIFQGLTPLEIEKLKILYAIAGLFSVLTFVLQPAKGALMAYEFFVESKLLSMLHKVGTVVLIVIALIMHGGVYVLVLINGAVGLIVSILRYLILVRKAHLKINWNFFDVLEMKKLFSFSFWVFLISMAQRFRLSFMPSLLGIFSNSTQISIFALGMSIEGMVWVLSTALNGLFLPKVSRLSHQGNTIAITNLMIKVGRIQLFIISLILTGFVVVGKQFLHLWVGDDFQLSYYVLLLLTGSNFVTLTQHVASDLVYADNKVRYTASLTFIASGLALLGSVLLAPRFGAVGCALSFFAAMMLNVVQLNVFYKKKLQIEVGRFFRECHFRIVPVLAVLCVVFFFLSTKVRLENWGTLILFAGIYALCYVFISYVFLFNEEEKNIVRQVCRVRKR